MTTTLRKLIATLVLLALVVVYAPLAMEVGAHVAAATGPVVQLVYFIVAGLGWTVPAGVLIWWAWRPR